MFNLGNLLTSISLSMGVANVTPIYDGINTKKADNVVNNYELTFSYTQTQTLTNNNQTINNYSYSEYNTGTIKDYKYNFANSNSYLNVLGNIYKTDVYYTANDTIKYYRNYLDKDNLNKDQYSSTEHVMVLKITPYNFNVNTEMTIHIQLTLKGFEPYIEDYIDPLNVYMYRKIYTTIQEDWNTYINKQLVKDTAKTIVNDITNINNGFYYNAEEDLEQLTVHDIENYSYNDELEITITPKVDNYIVINYAPMIFARYKDEQQNISDLETNNVMVESNSYSISPLNIQGTNVIADSSNYEVIDMPGLMFQILAMPFAFVSQAFNLTLFPGTPYQVNISNLFLSIIAIFVFIWLITMFLKMKG